MNPPSGRSPSHVPVLTEVVQVNARAPAATAEPALPEAALDASADPSDTEDAAGDRVQEAARAALGLSPLDEARLTQNVLADVQRQVDLMLDYRLRDAIGPVLARASDALISDLRAELAEALREVVARAVAQELARHRQRQAQR